MQQHGSKNILPADPPPPHHMALGDGVKKKVNFQLFQNTFIVHIKLKRIKDAAAWYQLFCPQQSLEILVWTPWEAIAIKKQSL